MDLYIQEYGSKISKERNHFIITTPTKISKIAVSKVETIIFQSNCSLTTNFIEMVVQEKIPIYFADRYGNIYGKLWKESLDSSAILRRKQLILFQGTYGRVLIKEWIIEKISTQSRHILDLMKRRKIQIPNISENFEKIKNKIFSLNIEEINFLEILRGYEGESSRYYYEELKKYIPVAWEYPGRRNYKATDPYNRVLNYLFAVLYSKVDHALTLANLDTKIGILHGESRIKDALSFDFIEKFRFLVWESTFSLFSRKKMKKSFFSPDVGISAEGKKIILAAFYEKLESKIEYEGKEISYKELMRLDARKIGRELLAYEDYNIL